MGMAELVSTRCALESLLMFFLWFMEAEFLAPLRRSLPFFYPDSSVVPHPYAGGAAGHTSWLGSMIVTDGLPRFTRSVQTLIAQLSSEGWEQELAVAQMQPHLVTDQTAAMLKPIKHLLDNYLCHLQGYGEKEMPHKVLAVCSAMEGLLSVRQGHEVAPALAVRSPTAVLGIQQTYKHCLKHLVAHDIPVNRVLLDFFVDLSKHLDTHTDPLDIICNTLRQGIIERDELLAWLQKHAKLKTQQARDAKAHLKALISEMSK